MYNPHTQENTHSLLSCQTYCLHDIDYHKKVKICYNPSCLFTKINTNLLLKICIQKLLYLVFHLKIFPMKNIFIWKSREVRFFWLKMRNQNVFSKGFVTCFSCKPYCWKSFHFPQNPKPKLKWFQLACYIHSTCMAK